MDQREAERFLAAWREVRASGGRAAAATVVRVHGSAYRREGTRMLIRPDGTYECALSGGCLEPAVAEAAARVLETGAPALLTYDLADDSVWGLNLGCSGAVDIRIERLDDDEVTTAWLHAIEHRDAAVLITPLGGLTGRRILFASGRTIGRLSDAGVEQGADDRARERLSMAHPASVADAVGAAEVFFEVNLPPPDLVTFGAGQDAIPLARQAWSMGFDVTIVDPRPSYLRADSFPAARLIATPFDAIPSALTIRRGSYILVMNHHLERDAASLRFALESAPAYVGVLGPPARFRQLLKNLERDGYVAPPEALALVRSPVGLALGAETPEEVAMSILAEILAVRRGFQGGFLSGAGRLHRPLERRSFARS